ncbi:MAG: hypothetical protein RL211_1084 [Pseudomonadota bacterium]|jgi:hypothetical protein
MTTTILRIAQGLWTKPVSLGPRAVGWAWRYPAVPTEQSYSASNMESGDVGCVATSAKRHSIGSAPGMTALAEGITMLARRRIVCA